MDWQVLRVVPFVAGIGAAAIAACDSFSSEPGATVTDSGREGDDDVGDAARDGPAADGDDDADGSFDAAVGPNYLMTSVASFASGCAGWGGLSGALISDSDAGRTAPGSCLVCPTTPGGGIYANTGNFLIEAGAYIGEAYVSVPASEGPDASEPVDTVLRLDEDLPQNTGGVYTATPSGWTRASVLLTINDGGTSFQLQVNSTVGTVCFLVDDARIYPSPP